MYQRARTAGDVLVKRVRRVKQSIVAAAGADADSVLDDHDDREALSRRALVHAYRKSKLAILDSILA